MLYQKHKIKYLFYKITIKLNCSLDKCDFEWNSMQKVELIQTIKFPKSFRNGTISSAQYRTN